LSSGPCEALGTGDKRAAFRLAQLELKRSQPHQFYWAAFQLIGLVK
jgi:CHAT domain-containing protein